VTVLRGTGGTGDQPVAVGQSGSNSRNGVGVFAINIGSAMKVPWGEKVK
jgi:hypothetical protein